MQNCNVSPQFLMKDCTLKPSAEAPYLFNGFLNLTEAYDNPLHQRAAACVDLLSTISRMTVNEAIDVAMSPNVFGADLWQETACAPRGAPPMTTRAISRAWPTCMP